jgi:Tfp pilus assembly protein PilO
VRARLDELSPRAQIALALGAVLVYGIALWLVVVSPRRSEVTRLDADVAAAELRLAEARAGAARPRKTAAPAADVVRLAKAMPASTDQASLVLELARLARGAGVTLGSITPVDPTTDASGATLVPATVTVTGSYRQVTRFLKRTRGLVHIRGGRLRATGRLLAVQSVELSESSFGKFPLLDATITFNAYAYDGPLAPPAPQTPPSPDESSTSGATAAGAAQ